MDYSFDKLIERRSTYSLKWDIKENELPMWVADMDLPTAPCVKEALANRVSNGIFGYSIVPDEWYEAYIGWMERRHHFRIERDSLIFTTGVIPAISSMVRKLTTTAEKVLLLTPVYNIFFNSVLNNGRVVEESELRYDGNSYSIDFKDLEKKLEDPQTTLMLLCNPHNPTGRIWTRAELEKIGELCSRNHVTVISDEIHGDLTDPGCEYIPFASVSEVCRRISITCLSPSKSFNLAGLQSAAVMVADEALRHKVSRGLNTDEVAEPNAFAITSTIAAYTEGDAYLDALRDYLKANKEYVRDYIEKNIPQLKVVPSEATYLLWIDCRGMIGCAAEAALYIREKTGLYLSEGSQYGKGGEDFLRLNIAAPRSLVEEGLGRLKKGIEAYEQYVSERC